MSVYEKLCAAVNKHGMMNGRDHVIVGLSGGADSVCLLINMKKICTEQGIGISAVHVNHCIRGNESDGDEQFCRELCERLDVQFTACRLDVPAYAAEHGMSLELAARKLRYEAFEKECGRYDSPAVATAHNRCDNSETMLFNMARGTGVRGMCGIPYVRGNIIRPLLDVTREEIEDFLSAEGQGYVTDSTNLSDDYSRNRIRHNVIPVLTGINEGFHQAAARLAASAYEDEQYFSELLRGLAAKDMPDQPAAVRKRFISSMLSKNGIEISYDTLCVLDECIRERKSTRYDLTGAVFAVFRKGIMSVEVISGKSYDISVSADISEDVEICIAEFDKTVKITGCCDDNFSAERNVNEKLTNSLFNYGKIQGAVILRTRKDGDRITLKGRNFSTRLKKLYNSLGLPLDERAKALVMEDEAGIIWSEYGGVSERVCVHDNDSSADIRKISVSYTAK